MPREYQVECAAQHQQPGYYDEHRNSCGGGNHNGENADNNHENTESDRPPN
jgi:hypothetical protein